MLQIRWQEPPFNDIYQRLLRGEIDNQGNIIYQGMPESKFYSKRFTVVPFSTNKTAFVITSSQLGKNVDIIIQSQSPSLQLRPTKKISVNLLNEEQTVLLNMDEGLNFVFVIDPVTKESVELVVNARRYATFLFSLAQESFNTLQGRITAQEVAIFSKYATRLVEPLVRRQYELLPNIKSLQLVALRLMTKTWTSKGNTDIGVREMGTALTLNRPWESQLNKDHTIFDPVRFPMETYQEFFSSKIEHLWVPNFSMARWKTFMTYVNNIQGFSLVDIDESEIIVQNNQGGKERHLFNFEQDDFFAQRRQFDLDIYVTLLSNIILCLIAPGYTFDLFVTEDAPLGDCRVTLDSGEDFDSNCPFDTEEYDPMHDGYVGLSLVDRNERVSPKLYPDGLGYSSTLCPEWGSAIPTLVYSLGFYTKVVDIDNTPVSVDATTVGELRINAAGCVYVQDCDGGFFLAPGITLDAGTFLEPLASCDGGLFA